jgi:hypothetical protein
MFDYSCLFRYGDNHVGGWFKTSSQIRWAILAKSETGEVVSRLERPTPKLAGSEPLPELGNA